MLDFYVVDDESDVRKLGLKPRISLGGPLYWFLHRYFVHASLSPAHFSFLNPNEDTMLQGYRLHRLKSELESARIDISTRSGELPVLVGWTGDTVSVDSEQWETIDVAKLRQAISLLLELVAEAQVKNKFLYALGD